MPNISVYVSLNISETIDIFDKLNKQTYEKRIGLFLNYVLTNFCTCSYILKNKIEIYRDLVRLNVNFSLFHNCLRADHVYNRCKHYFLFVQIAQRQIFQNSAPTSQYLTVIFNIHPANDSADLRRADAKCCASSKATCDRATIKYFG